jgi:hypothetical protein
MDGFNTETSQNDHFTDFINSSYTANTSPDKQSHKANTQQHQQRQQQQPSFEERSHISNNKRIRSLVVPKMNILIMAVGTR